MYTHEWLAMISNHSLLDGLLFVWWIFPLLTLKSTLMYSPLQLETLRISFDLTLVRNHRQNDVHTPPYAIALNRPWRGFTMACEMK